MLRPGKRITTPGEGFLKYTSTAFALALFCTFVGVADVSSQAQAAESNSVSHDGDTGDAGGGRDGGTNGDNDSGRDGDNNGGRDGDGDGGSGRDGDDNGGRDGDRDRGTGRDGDDNGGRERDRGGDTSRGGSTSGSAVSSSSTTGREDSCRNSLTYGNSDVLRQRCNGPFYR